MLRARLWADRGLVVLVGLFLLLLPIATPRISATDEVQYYVYLRSLRFDGDLNFENDYREFARRNPSAGIEALLQPNRVRAQTGRYGNIAPVGCAIMWVPFFLLADVLVHLARLLGARVPADGYSWPYLSAVCYGSALYGLGGLLLSYRLARRYVSMFAATVACATIWLASPLVFYMYIRMPFAHSTGLFLVALFMWVWQRTRTERPSDGTSERPSGAASEPHAPTLRNERRTTDDRAGADLPSTPEGATTRSLNRSSTQALNRSSAQSLQRSIAPTLNRSNAQSLQRSIAQSLQRSIAQSLQRSIAQSLQRSIAPTLNRSNAQSLGRSCWRRACLRWAPQR